VHSGALSLAGSFKKLQRSPYWLVERIKGEEQGKGGNGRRCRNTGRFVSLALGV